MAIDVIEKDKKEIRWLGLSNETTNELSGVEVTLSTRAIHLTNLYARANYWQVRKD
jgi:predicted NUDIX family phosphoesterase